MNMGKVISAYGLGLGLLTLSGLLLDYDGLAAASTTQFNFFVVLLKAYTPIITPLSSILGSPAIGSTKIYGALPAALWLLAAFISGSITQETGSSAKAMFLTASTILLLWIASLFLSAPVWPDYTRWLSVMSKMAAELISKPLDILSLLIAPTASSALAGGLIQLIQGRAVKKTRVEEDSYPF